MASPGYLKRHAAVRRAAAKAEGARRTDVTLRGKMLDEYAAVRGYLEQINNQLGIERDFWKARQIPK